VKKSTVILISMALFAVSCNNKENKESMKNPLLQEFNTPFEVPPFDQISLTDFAPAIRHAIKVQNQEITDITDNIKTPDFLNTIVAYEQSGSLLSRARSVFFNLNSSLTSDEMQKIAEELHLS